MTEQPRRQLRILAELLVQRELCEQNQISHIQVSKRAGMMMVSRDPLIYISERRGMLTIYREPDTTLFYGDSTEAATFIKGWYAGADQAKSK